MNGYVRFLSELIAEQKLTALITEPLWISSTGKRYWLKSDIPANTDVKKCIIAGGMSRSTGPWKMWLRDKDLDWHYMNMLIFDVPEAHEMPRHVYLADLPKYERICTSIVMQMLLTSSRGTDIYFGNTCIMKAHTECETQVKIDLMDVSE